MPSDVNRASNRWQFHLRRIFELTTISAIAAAVAAHFGPGSLLTSGGILLAWLNARGAFQSVQSGPWQIRILWLAWATFLVSLALPSVKVFGPVQGANAAWFAAVAPLTAIAKGDALEPALLAYLAIDVANVLIALLPLLVWRLSNGRGQRFAAVLCTVMVSAWSIGWEGSMLVGYYTWCASFWLALVAIPVRASTLLTMVAMAFGVAVAEQWSS